MSLETQPDMLLDPMTLPGRVGQMCQRVPDLDDQIWRGNAGAVICSDSSPFNRLQKFAVKESRLSIPVLCGRDIVQWVFEPGEFEVWIAPHAGAGLAARFVFGREQV